MACSPKGKMRSSDEWAKYYADKFEIIDPDGWDRSPEGWNESWNLEMINEEEFMRRVARSTILSKIPGHNSIYYDI